MLKLRLHPSAVCRHPAAVLVLNFLQLFLQPIQRALAANEFFFQSQHLLALLYLQVHDVLGIAIVYRIAH